MKTFTLLNAYQSHESELKTIMDFVSPIEEHDSVYSPQIAKHLLNSGIAFEGLCKLIGAHFDKHLQNIGEYKELILVTFPKIHEFEVQIAMQNRILKPFDGWDKSKLSWWKNYVKLKHNYFENLHLGCLGEALKAISAYLILILYFSYLEHGEQHPSVPSSLAPSLLIPKDYSSDNFQQAGFFYTYPLLVG